MNSLSGLRSVVYAETNGQDITSSFEMERMEIDRSGYDDQLVICYSQSERPANVETTKGNDLVLIKWTRK